MPRPRARSIRPRIAEQLVFEVEAAMMLANAMFVIAQEPTPLVRARRAITRRLAEAAPKAA